MRPLPGYGYCGVISIPDIVLDVNINILYLVFHELRAKKAVVSTNDCQRPFIVKLVSGILTVCFLKSAFPDGDIDIGSFSQIILKIKLGMIKNVSAVVKPVVENKTPCLSYIFVQCGSIGPLGTWNTAYSASGISKASIPAGTKFLLSTTGPKK